MSFLLPKRRKPRRMMVRLPSTIDCRGHLKWVRGHECAIAGKTGRDGLHVCTGRIEAHHTTTRGAGGGDETAVPLCSLAHSLVHGQGFATFALDFKADLQKIAADLWKASPHRIKLEQENR